MKDVSKSIGRLEGAVEAQQSVLEVLQGHVKEIGKSQHEMNLCLGRIEENLAEHMRRSHALEEQNKLTEEKLERHQASLAKELEPIKSHVKTVTGVLKTFAAIIAGGGAIATMMKVFLLLCVVLLLSGGGVPRPDGAQVVRLTGIDGGSCSGVQVTAPSGVDYILSAGHCLVLQKDGVILAESPGKAPIPRRVILESDHTDLLLLEGMPGLKGAELGRTPGRNSEIYAITHGAGFDHYSSRGEVVQEKTISVLDYVIESDEQREACGKSKKRIVEKAQFLIFEVDGCFLRVRSFVTTLNAIAGGSSGGPAFDATGKLIGIVFAGGGPSRWSLRRIN